jgi:hypothetical protein
MESTRESLFFDGSAMSFIAAASATPLLELTHRLIVRMQVCHP